jgi:uncharacterized phage protein (TIGR02220 family)
MSIRVMSAVWDHFPRGGSEMLVALALADWCNDAGASLHPSIHAIAVKCRLSDAQARRIVHQMIDTGLLEVVGNQFGGPPGASRQYQFRIDRLTTVTNATPTPIADVSPTASTHARDGLHPCTQTPSTGVSQTIIEPSVNHQTLEVLGYLNLKASRSYRPVPPTCKLIAARLTEGATVDEMKKVIDAKVTDWRDSDMAKYLRPETLFNATKFAQYVGQVGDGPGTQSNGFEDAL